MGAPAARSSVRASGLRGRKARAAQSYGCAASAIGDIEAGMSLFALTRGQWSMIDAILHVLDQVGPSFISVWTWTVAEYEVETLTRLRIDKRLTGGRLVIDGGARGRNAGLIAEWKGTFGPGSVRYVMNHAKLARVESASGMRVLLRGSMNLNFNPRFEQFDLTEGGEDFELVAGVEDELPVLEDDCRGDEIWKASRVSDAFDRQDLALFTGMRVWAK